MIEVDLRDNPDCMANGLNLSRRLRPLGADGRHLQLASTIPCRRTRAASAASASICARTASSASRCIRRPARSPPPTSPTASPIPCSARSPSSPTVSAWPRRGACIPPSSGVDLGRSASGQPFVNEVYLGCTGGAGTPHDRRLADDHACRQCRHVLPGLDRDRRAAPSDLRRMRAGCMPDTEGAGRFRGAPSAYSEFSPLGCDMTVAYVSDGNVNPAKGVRGGAVRGRRRRSSSSAPTARSSRCPAAPRSWSAPGEAMVSISCGGGGYGPPRERAGARSSTTCAKAGSAASGPRRSTAWP